MDTDRRKKIELFRMKAIAAGVPAKEINAFIDRKEKEYQLRVGEQTALEESSANRELAQLGDNDAYKDLSAKDKLGLVNGGYQDPTQELELEEQQLDLETKRQNLQKFKEPTAAEKEAVLKKEGEQASIGELSNNILTLEQQRQQIKNRGPLRGLVPALGGAGEAEIGGFESAKNITAYRMAEVLAGQTGRAISDTDRKIFFDALPKRTDKDEVARDKIDTALILLENKLTASGTDKQTIKGITDPVRTQLGATKKSMTPKQQELLKTLGVKPTAQTQVQSEQVTNTPVMDLIRPAVPAVNLLDDKGRKNIGTALGVLAPVGAAKLLAKPFAVGAASKSRDTVTKALDKAGVKFPTKPLVEAGKKYLNADELARPYAEKILPKLAKAKDLTPTQLVERMKIWNKAYSAAGETGKSAKAGFYDALKQAAKKEVTEIAPKLGKETGKISGAIKRKKVVGSFTRQAGQIAAGIGAYSLINKLIGK